LKFKYYRNRKKCWSYSNH